jgi:hypothetical protein
LRALLVLVTAVCIFLGWQTSIVRTRRTAIEEFKKPGAFQMTLADDWQARFPPGVLPPEAAKVPLIRAWLGDKAVQEIWMTRHYQGFSEAEMQRLRKVFPEAEFREIHPEPCHPGCFPSGTLVETPTGPRRIETISIGDPLLTIRPDSQTLAVPVTSIFITRNYLWRVETDRGDLVTTETQPLCLASSEILPAGQLEENARILCFQQGKVRIARVLRVTRTARTEQVINLVLSNSEIFVAGGFLARSKPPLSEHASSAP